MPTPPSDFPEPTYPTPLTRLVELSHADAEVWLKDDGRTHAAYGGNKVRQVVALVRAAEARGARRVLTFGAAGSHHVLTTTLFARARGLGCAAVLFAQPRTEHAVATLRASVHAGVEAFAAPSGVAAPVALARAFATGDALVAPGGWGVRGAAAYADAVGELVAQLRERGEEAPDCIVAPLGTGTTVAGLLAGVALNGLATEVLGVAVVKNPFARVLAEQLAGAVLRKKDAGSRRRGALRVEHGFVGEGYGVTTREGDAALARCAALGLELDPTYTAKTMACVLALVERLRGTRRARPLRIVYWHTLSAAPLEPLLVGAPAFAELPDALQRLLT